MVLPHVDKLVGIIFIGQKTTTTGRLGIIVKTKLGSQRHLWLTRATAKAKKLITVYPALTLG